ncbi:hypothetical protein NM208_g2682 [Fusarium decemcellulare]|uniref:Uncharacterized protein n=1 Tax=Fusarium decemcellulare TaxID=57161 RepID=A0ACC1SRX9_9HYPO|nr:hypothetical protein NM208_g2682 [Fusarium decemcellulare]
MSSSWVEPAGPESTPDTLYEDCKQGLARCIYEHPHLSGIIVKDETGRNAIEIRHAPFAGTNFWYQDYRDDPDVPSYDELRNAGWPFGDGEQDGLSKLRPKDFPCSQNGDPVIAPQFNVIRGGVVLTMSIAHAIGDLVQFMTFVRSWAQHTCAVANARTKGDAEPPLPQQIAAHLMDRSLLSPDVQIEEDLDKLAARATNLPHLSMLDPRYSEEMEEQVEALFTKARLTNRDLENFTEDALRVLSCSVWTFSQSSIKELQHVAQKASHQNSKLSSVDCLTAFAWSRFFIAKYAPNLPGPEPVPETSRIVFAGSIRRRLTPPLPDNYMPACVDLFPVNMKTCDFTSSTPEALVKAATTVRSSNNNWNEGAFRDMLEIAHSHPMSPGLIPKGPIDALVTDHTRASTAVFEDWGPGLGRCEAFREPYLGRIPPRGEITLLPRWNNGNVDVMFAGEAVVLERLRRDTLMNEVASCQFVMGKVTQKVSLGQYLSKL